VRIGYPCVNRSLACRASRTFRLRNYSAERLLDTAEGNLECLEEILRWNLERGVLFFRLTSDLVPFASHPVCDVEWQRWLAPQFARIGKFVREHRMRVAMHPDQFTLINSRDPEIFERSVRELVYHAEVLDLVGARLDARIQIHVGGVYGDRRESMNRFARRFRRLPRAVRRRLVVENDDRSYTLSDCLRLSRRTGVPVVLDVLHHRLNSSGEPLGEALRLAAATWGRRAGPPIVDYSEGQPGAPRGAHAESIDRGKFRRFLRDSAPGDFDVMLEIKDKEKSALGALWLARNDPRLLAPARSAAV
jgi:UV DNA damage endonuclease